MENQVYHFNEVDQDNITAVFSADKKHRISLEIPFRNGRGNKTLCIIGQNPSAADKERADPTILFLEQFVYHTLPQYSKIIMLNLYTRVDTNRVYQDDVIRIEFQEEINKIIENNSDFLIVWGQLTNDKPYHFIEKANKLKLKLAQKNIYKVDLGDGSNYAPHPLRVNYKFGHEWRPLIPYNFEDIP